MLQPGRPSRASASQDDDLSFDDQHALFIEDDAAAGEETEVEPEGAMGNDAESAPQLAHGAGDRPLARDFAEAISAWAAGVLAVAGALLVRRAHPDPMVEHASLVQLVVRGPPAPSLPLALALGPALPLRLLCLLLRLPKALPSFLDASPFAFSQC